jgi:UDP-N-acetylglucosamine 1-carboxyvinyltransferase
MDKFIINGGKKLSGTVAVVGAKNAALKALAASLLLDGKAILKKVPQIEDIHRLIDIMKDIGVEIEQDGSTYTINSSKVSKTVLEPHLHQKIRSSVLLVGPMLLQTGEVAFPHPGGCVIGQRPIDYFLDGFEKFGVKIENRSDGYTLSADDLHAAKIVFPRVSVTGTEAMMMFASKIPGITTLMNSAMEPEIPALAEFLNSCGAKITGAGTSTLTIEGVSSLSGGTYVTPPDRIEAGTFAILGAASGSEITVSDIDPSHLEILWELFRKANVQFTLGETSVTMHPSQDIKSLPKDIVTHEYPGLPTDIQAPLTVLMTQAKGNSLVFETVYEGRLFYIDKLISMGADILMCDPHRVLVTGPTPLYGKKISSPDIRAGIALVIAGLIAHGQTEIDNVYQIDRGYERIEERLRGLGADITRIKE